MRRHFSINQQVALGGALFSKKLIFNGCERNGLAFFFFF